MNDNQNFILIDDTDPTFLQKDKKIVISLVERDGLLLKYASKKLQNDFNVVIIAVKNDSYALQYASKKLQNNEEIVIEAVKYHNNTLCYASKKLRSKFNNILKLIGFKDFIYFQKNFRIKEKLIINNRYCKKYFTVVLKCISRILKKKNEFQILPSHCFQKIYKYIDILDLKPFIKNLKEK